MTTDSPVDRLRSLLREATPGPWVPQSESDGRVTDWYIDTHYSADGPEPVVPPPNHSYGMTAPDAEIAAATVNALPLLLDLWEAAAAFDAVADEQDDYTQSPARETSQHAFRAALAALEAGAPQTEENG